MRFLAVLGALAAPFMAFRDQPNGKSGEIPPIPDVPKRASTKGRRHNPAGIKRIMRYYKVKHGYKAKDAVTAWEWWNSYNPAPR